MDPGTRTPSLKPPAVAFYGGWWGALAPFVLFVVAVVALGLSGAPDERGFWPVLVLALALALALARDRTALCEAMVAGMSRPLVALMITAWLLAGVLAVVLRAGGLIDALVWSAHALGLHGGVYVAAAFAACCLVSTATGTSLGTILLCAPLLYPAGGALGAAPAVLIGAILGGATFGDNVSPVSDTTIASATTQGAAMGEVVRSRLRYALPAAGAALAVFALAGGRPAAGDVPPPAGDGTALPLLAAPAVAILLLVRRHHLFVGLLAGVATAVAVALGLGLITPAALFYVDPQRFGARGLVVEGMERGIGVSIFTLLLMALVAAVESSGVMAHLLQAAGRRARDARGAELLIVALASAAVLLTTHSVVAILIAGGFARKIGERFALSAPRRANLLDVTVCTYPFLLPWFIPTILAASTTRGHAAMPPVSAWSAGLWNLHSWGLLAVLLLAVASGWGRDQ
ncbi:MAG: hypothetical protein D6696_02750 [Acidobacteria bacterium]|nr:MAG: hypothetical protein D6696_02750 [Acidobacteriota bacterium]